LKRPLCLDGDLVTMVGWRFKNKLGGDKDTTSIC
jgi:hypothetical protein